MKAKLKLKCHAARLVLGAAMVLSVGVSPAMSVDQETIDAAIEEGKLVYVTNLHAPDSQPELHQAFRDYYDLPDSFEIEGTIGSSTSVVSRVMQELDAGTVTADWVSVNAGTFWKDLEKRDAILEYCSEEYEGLTYIEEAAVEDGGCYYQTVAAIVFGLIWNPAYVEDEITTWAELTDPKYQGQIIFGDPRKSAAYLDVYVGLRENGVWTDEWLKQIRGQEPFFLLRSTDIRDRVMSGEFPVAILGFPPRAYQVRDQVELKSGWPEEGVVVAGNYGGILKEAENPNAAKLWTDFIFSKVGQEHLIRLEAAASLRSDVDIPEDVRPFVPDMGEINAAPMDWGNLTGDKLDEMREDFRSIFGQED